MFKVHFGFNSSLEGGKNVALMWFGNTEECGVCVRKDQTCWMSPVSKASDWNWSSETALWPINFHLSTISLLNHAEKQTRCSCEWPLSHLSHPGAFVIQSFVCHVQRKMRRSLVETRVKINCGSQTNWFTVWDAESG